MERGSLLSLLVASERFITMYIKELMPLPIIHFLHFSFFFSLSLFQQYYEIHALYHSREEFDI